MSFVLQRSYNRSTHHTKAMASLISKSKPYYHITVINFTLFFCHLSCAWAHKTTIRTHSLSLSGGHMVQLRLVSFHSIPWPFKRVKSKLSKLYNGFSRYLPLCVLLSLFSQFCIHLYWIYLFILRFCVNLPLLKTSLYALLHFILLLYYHQIDPIRCCAMVPLCYGVTNW